MIRALRLTIRFIFQYGYLLGIGAIAAWAVITFGVITVISFLMGLVAVLMLSFGGGIAGAIIVCAVAFAFTWVKEWAFKD